MKLFQLLRPINLAIIAVTMYGLGWYLEDFTNHPNEIFSLPFNLLVLSTIMIAGAGNIINDYFDVKADRINKPEKIIIGKFVKRRVAILLNWILNISAFGIAIYLSYELNTFWYLFVHILTINLLWNYSMFFKRRFFIGNVLVAVLTGLVPVLVGFYFYHQMNHSSMSLDIDSYGEIELLTGGLTWLVGALGIFAFMLNLAREIIKDIEDVEGDKMLHAKTLAIKLGQKKAGLIANIILIVTAITMLFFLIDARTIALHLLPLAIIALFMMTLSSILLFKAQSKSQYRRVNHLIKVAMICGILIPVYVRIILQYY